MILFLTLLCFRAEGCVFVGRHGRAACRRFLQALFLPFVRLCVCLLAFISCWGGCFSRSLSLSAARYVPTDALLGARTLAGVGRLLLPCIVGFCLQALALLVPGAGGVQDGSRGLIFPIFLSLPLLPALCPLALCRLQGRLPIRVQLKGLSEEDLYKILTEPKNNLIRQQVEIMKTEGVRFRFTAGNSWSWALYTFVWRCFSTSLCSPWSTCLRFSFLVVLGVP